MAQDINSPSSADEDDQKTAPKRWLRMRPLARKSQAVPHLFGTYWTAPERRISSLTLKVVSVNAVALIMLVIGILYLGQYQNSTIENKLANFERELTLMAHMLSHIPSSYNSAYNNDDRQVMFADIIAGIPNTQISQVAVFNSDTKLWISDTYTQPQISAPIQNKDRLHSVEMLKSIAKFLMNLVPKTTELPPYPAGDGALSALPDIQHALRGNARMSVWEDGDDGIIISGAAPITTKTGDITGALVFVRNGDDIRAILADGLQNILKIFFATFLVTMILSLYLANTIAYPLKKLANAAERLRAGRSQSSEIPDYSHRYDEIGELSIALRAMTDALWARMDSIESFAADVAHELKNPLTSMRSALETLDKVSNKSDREKLFTIVHHDLTRMQRLITDISRASRLDSELSKEIFTRCDVYNVLRHLIISYQNPLDRADSDGSVVKTAEDICILLRIDNEDSDIYITRGIETRLKQVFENILSNALSFSKMDDQITITLKRDDTWLSITIDDMGPGIGDNDMNKIFDRFYTQRPDTDYGQNSGLGLSICKQIINSHYGEIVAHNIYDDDQHILGARFCVTLPCAVDRKMKE